MQKTRRYAVFLFILSCALSTSILVKTRNIPNFGNWQEKKETSMSTLKISETDLFAIENRIVLCTSTMGRYYNDMLTKSKTVLPDMVLSARLGNYNLLSRESLSISSKYKMRIYTEDSFDAENGRPLVKKEKLENVVYIDIFKAFKWLKDFVVDERNSVYMFHRQVKKLFNYERTTEDTDLGLLRKILAISDTLNNTPDDTIVLWVDLDTYFMNEFSSEVLKYLINADVTYIPAFSSPDCVKYFPFTNNLSKKNSCGICAETGILAYVSSKKTRKVLQEQIDWVLKEATIFQNLCFEGNLQLPGCALGFKKGICDVLVSLNDIAVFGNSMWRSLHNVTQQFFSTGCLQKTDGEWVNFAQLYKQSGSQLCREDSLTLPTSSFNILKYVMHFRGTTTGLAKRRSIWNKEVAKPKISFTNSYRKHGAKHQKLQNIS